MPGNAQGGDEKVEEDDAGFGSMVLIRNIDLHDNPARNINLYFASHKDLQGLHATTSCFSIWRAHGNCNGYAKVIPATRSAVDPSARVFFFDDNIDFTPDCSPTCSGICNLRDTSTGEFVSFADGQNGFKHTTYAEHTMIHSSDPPHYNVTLVKANILDAMEQKDYFVKIVEKYSRPGEKIIAYMDINSTIVFSDVMTGKNRHAVLLSTMFECINFNPTVAFEIQWDETQGKTAIPKKPISVKKLVKKMLDLEGYKSFWNMENCQALLCQLLSRGSVTWHTGGEMSQAQFDKLYLEYSKAMDQQVEGTGIVSSWFTFYRWMEARGNQVMLNTFGVDSRKIILTTVPNERDVTLTTANYEKWSIRDMKTFESQYSLGSV